MPVREYKPTSPSRRGMSSQDFDAITTNKPLKDSMINPQAKFRP